MSGHECCCGHAPRPVPSFPPLDNPGKLETINHGTVGQAKIGLAVSLLFVVAVVGWLLTHGVGCS